MQRGYNIKGSIVRQNRNASCAVARQGDVFRLLNDIQVTPRPFKRYAFNRMRSCKSDLVNHRCAITHLPELFRG